MSCDEVTNKQIIEDNLGACLEYFNNGMRSLNGELEDFGTLTFNELKARCNEDEEGD